jgi:hypothetical protein
MPEATLDSLISNPLEDLLGKEQFYALREEALKKYSNLITKIDEKAKAAFGLDKTVDSFKKSIEEKTKKIKESKTGDVLPQVAEQKKDNTENKNNPLYRIKDTATSAVLPKSIENIKTKEVGEEQKTLGPKVQLIEFSDKTQGFLKGLFKNIGMDPKMQDEFKKYFKDSIEKQDEMLANTKQDGFLGMIGKILAIGGIATILVTAFWDKIKPWLENALGTKLDFLDKFEGLAEGIGKFFTMGGLKISIGGILSTVGKAFTSFGELIESVLKGAINMILPASGEIAEGGAQAAAKSGGLFKSLLPKIAGGLFKGVGMVALKGIPVIGGLISLYFAVDRFQKSDYIGGVIDLVGGLANFIPWAGIPLSLGLAGLNAFLDYKSDGVGGEAGQDAKKVALGGIFTGLGNMLMKVPFIASLVNGITGTWDFITGILSGDIATLQIGINGMKNIPLFGPIASFFENILAAGTPANANTGSRFSATTLMENIKKKVGKTILGWFSWLPSWLYKDIADFMGIPVDNSGNIVEEPKVKPTKTPQQLAQEKINQRKKELGSQEEIEQFTPEQLEKQKKDPTITNADLELENKTKQMSLDQEKRSFEFNNQAEEATMFDNIDLNAMLNPMAGMSQMMEQISKIDLNNLDKGMLENNSENNVPKILEDKTDTRYEPAKPDAPPKTTDPDVIMQKTNESTNILIKTVHSLIQTLKDNQENPIPITVNTAGGASNSSNDYLFKEQPVDPNTLARKTWWSHSQYMRATI